MENLTPLEVRPPAASPAQSPASPANERAELAKAIARRAEAEKRADEAKALADKAEQLRADARAYVDEIRAKHRAKASELRDAHAKAISNALREGRRVPGTAKALPTPDQPPSPPLRPSTTRSKSRPLISPSKHKKR